MALCAQELSRQVCNFVWCENIYTRGGELGVLGVREHPLVAKSTLSKSKKTS